MTDSEYGGEYERQLLSQVAQVARKRAFQDWFVTAKGNHGAAKGPRKAGERAVSGNFYFEQPPNGSIQPSFAALFFGCDVETCQEGSARMLTWRDSIDDSPGWTNSEAVVQDSLVRRPMLTRSIGVVPFFRFFGWEASPAEIDYRKPPVRYPCSKLSTGPS